MIDNVGLNQAMKSKYPVLPIFIFDTNILHKLQSTKDARVQFIHSQCIEIKKKLEGHSSWICELVFSGDGSRLYSASGDQTIRIWNVAEGLCLATLRGSRHEVYGLALSPDESSLASACKDGVSVQLGPSSLGNQS